MHVPLVRLVSGRAGDRESVGAVGEGEERGEAEGGVMRLTFRSPEGGACL